MLKRFLIPVLLLLASCSICQAAPEQWVEVSSSHFDVYTNAGEKQGRHVLDQFERMRWVFRTLFPTVNGDPPAPMIVVAVRNRKDFQAMEPEAYLAKGQIELGGLFLRTQDQDYILIRLDSPDEEHPFAVVYHEYTHSQFTRSESSIPLWLNEGLAEFFENTTMRDKNVTVGEPSRTDILYLRQTTLIPLPVLLRVDKDSPYYHQEQKGSVFYAESWALTHYLLVNDRAHKTNQVGEYLRLMDRHEDPVAAAEKAFGEMKKLQEGLWNYMQQAMYTTFVLNSAAEPLDEGSIQVRPVSDEEATSVRGEVLAAVGRTKEAKDLANGILAQDAKSVYAREVLGMIAFRERDMAETGRWYDEAVKLGSQNYLDYYYAATRGMFGGGAENAEAVSELARAIELNPNFAPAYDRLAGFYMMRREKLDVAYKLVVKAVNLDPGQLSYRMNAASIMTEMGRFDEAERVLTSVVNSGLNPKYVAQAQNMLDSVRRMQTAGGNADAGVRFAQPGAAAGANSGGVVDVVPGGSQGQVVEVVKEVPPKHPTESATGPKRWFEGVIRGVTCSYPAVMDFRVESEGKSIAVYTNNYYKLDVTAAGFTPEGDIHPCQDFEGRKAKVEYAESSDKTVDGQVVAVELHK